MPFIANSKNDRKQMLEAIGVDAFSDLIANIPAKIQLQDDLNLGSPMSEVDAYQHLEQLASLNLSGVSFVGGGAYDHYSPAIVDAVISRSEFMTAYTPYQAEVSQGTLQVIYEFQTHICRLTGMEVANASMYDGASALAEALVVAIKAERHNRILIPAGLHPAYLEVAKTYLHNYDVAWEIMPAVEGRIDVDAVAQMLDESVTAVVLQQPNYFGLIEDAGSLGDLVKNLPAMLIACVDPSSLGLLEAPGNYHADIVVGEGQSLGIPLSFGGPFVGFFATREKYIRQLPGRIVGVSEDDKGRRGYLLTLQTREQHIRREKATSNICTNSGLMALAATVYLAWLGPHGLQKLNHLIYDRSHYLAAALAEIPGFDLAHAAPFYKEFVLFTPLPATDIISAGLARGIKAGIDVTAMFNRPALLLAVTERRNKAQMHDLVELCQQFSR
jgi:glycine dehydrogenase subunit 1